LLLSFVFAATWFISTAMAAHLPRLMQAAGTTAAAAIVVGTLIGPAQVAARLFEYGVLSRVHPLLSARLASALHPLGVAALWIAGPVAAPVFGILHGAGNGILTIAKGTLPLVLFGPAGYGQRQGVLMVPARMAQALAPWVFGLALDRWGAGSLVLSAAISLAALVALLALRPVRDQPPHGLEARDART
ncbi:MAG TPA: MFS transporter, partial [Ramlibacter sp.]